MAALTPAFIASTKATATATSISANKPTGTVANTLLVAGVHGDTAGGTIVTNDSHAWNARLIDATNGSNMYVLWRVATAADGSTYSFRRGDSASDNFSIIIDAYSGVNPANPINSFDSFNRVSSTTDTIAAFNTDLNNCMVVTMLGIGSNTTVTSTPAGYSVGETNDGFNPGLVSYHKLIASAGTTGTIGWTVNASTTLKGYALALRPSSGYLYVQGLPGTGANTDNAGSAISWTNATRIQSADALLSTATCSGVTASDFLDGTNYGFSVPSNATLMGIELSNVARSRSGGTSGNARDNSIRLLNSSGTAVGTDKVTTTSWPTVAGPDVIYGGPDDLWSSGLTVSDVTSSGFGGRFAIQGDAAGANRVAQVDAMRMTVYYVVQGGGNQDSVLLEKRSLVS